MLKTLFIVVVLSIATLEAEELSVSGRVLDAAGAAIPGANIQCCDQKQETIETDGHGQFAIRVTSLPAAVAISAPGFETLHTKIESNGQIFSLRLASTPEVIEVTSTRMKQERALRAADSVILDRVQIEQSPSRMPDDLLRTVPGFQLFRRTSSLAANPTSQGVSLRGLGASGASRALVIEDLVPLNDPFGGWVYWDRIPKLSLDRIEVIRSGESDVYGRDALGGVVQLIPVSDDNFASIESSGGNRGAGDASGIWTRAWKKWALAADGSIFRWDGYTPVAFDQRGAVDTDANVLERTGQIRISHRFTESNELFVGGSWFGEERQNGTFLQTNRTAAQSAVAGTDFAAGGGLASIRGFADWEHFHQSFSAIALDRDSESLTRLQFVPVQRYGFESQWVRGFHSDDSVVIGASASHVDGVDDEVAYSLFVPQSRTVAGGIQNSFGFFGHLSLKPFKRLFVGLGGRLDRWENTSGFFRREVFAGPRPLRTDFADKQTLEASPRVSVGWSIRPNFMLSAAAYKAFRPPTLNELYRSFRVGNVVTQSNQGLSSERLDGVEAGFDLRLGRVHIAQTFFYNELRDAIANVTLSTTPALITRQRQNAGLIRSRGIDVVLDGRFAALHWIAGYEFADSAIISFPSQPILVGKMTAQSPRHSWSVSPAYIRPSWSVAAELRGTSRQFDDDLNRFPLAAFTTVGLQISKDVHSGVSLFAAAENLIDQKIEVGATPVTTLGPPLRVRAGIRIENPRHR